MFEIKFNNQKVTPSTQDLPDGFKIIEFDYQPTTPDDIIKLTHEDVLDGTAYDHIGDYFLKQAMIWTGDPNMPYEKNTSEASRLKTIFDNLNNISLSMQQPGKSFGEFQINANGILTEFMNDDGSLKTSTATTAGKIVNLIQGETDKAISQMSDRLINLTVAKDDLISEINVQAGSTLIKSTDGEKTNVFNITPETSYIQNATITDAMIKNMSANKITAGTIDANTINVINVNMKNLVGDFAQFAKTLWASLSTQVYIDGTGMKVFRIDGTNSVDIDEDGMDFKDHRGIDAGSIGWSKYVNKDYGALNITALRGHDVALASKRNGDYAPGVPEISVSGYGKITVWSPIYGGHLGRYGALIVSGDEHVTVRCQGENDSQRHGAIFLMDSGEVRLSLRSGGVVSIDSMFNDISSLYSRIRALESRG